MCTDQTEENNEIRWQTETNISEWTNKFFDFTLWFLVMIKTRKPQHLFSTLSTQMIITHIVRKIILKDDLLHVTLPLVVYSWIDTPVFINFTEG